MSYSDPMANQTRVCACGAEFPVANWEIKAGRGKYCSQECKYKYRTRPQGLRYKIVAKNQSWIQKGQRLSPETEFRRGQIPHNFKGDAVGYGALHDWVKRHRGKATTCEWCASTLNVQWANKSFLYKRDLDDWLALCYRCHRKYDKHGDWGAASRKFPEIRRGRVAA